MKIKAMHIIIILMVCFVSCKLYVKPTKHKNEFLHLINEMSEVTEIKRIPNGDVSQITNEHYQILPNETLELATKFDTNIEKKLLKKREIIHFNSIRFIDSILVYKNNNPFNPKALADLTLYSKKIFYYSNQRIDSVITSFETNPKYNYQLKPKTYKFKYISDSIILRETPVNRFYLFSIKNDTLIKELVTTDSISSLSYKKYYENGTPNQRTDYYNSSCFIEEKAIHKNIANEREEYFRVKINGDTIQRIIYNKNNDAVKYSNKILNVTNLYTFDYKYDDRQNWIKKTTYTNKRINEEIKRTIIYR